MIVYTNPLFYFYILGLIAGMFIKDLVKSAKMVKEDLENEAK